MVALERPVVRVHVPARRQLDWGMRPAWRPFDLGAKRTSDILMALIALVVLFPLILLVCLAVKLQDGGPALFAHRRVGQRGRSFSCLKVRTMFVDSDERLRAILEASPVARAEWARDHKLRNDPRVTPVGRFLRRTSLDELPQLLNILAGDMSVVGPRPIVDSEVGRYGHYISEYCGVKPGLTGLWQVSGRNDINYRKRVALDVVYCRGRSFGMDLKIIVMTVPALLSGRGCY
jgi:exopolysaccharide production protein ExoY